MAPSNCHIGVKEPENLVRFFVKNPTGFKQQCEVILSRSCFDFSNELERARKAYNEDSPQKLYALVAEWNAAAKNGVGMWCPHSNHLVRQTCDLAFGSYLICSLCVVYLFWILWQRRYCWWYPKLLRQYQRKLVVSP